MANVELGKGLRGYDTVHIMNAGICRPDACPYKIERSKCTRNNGDATLLFYHGVTRNTPEEVKKEAPCASTTS